MTPNHHTPARALAGQPGARARHRFWTNSGTAGPGRYLCAKRFTPQQTPTPCEKAPKQQQETPRPTARAARHRYVL
ncbi:hypothetical protein [Corynebacterium aquilae]|uniref:Uncharacterized protein n=1 Tax=Corynebacterium aquilae DSM 44791 TaxID=1431546 RepID=A0A1L7CF75_9CORY|nr:hypothetical protein [Corynebacterium aquilae]APT84499.1 hypothetical protein CAQU_04845 [Corynebacterium aquilae DSM 44791]